MNGTMKQMARVMTFYKSLPSEILKEALENLDANRTIRRSLARIKSLPNKVNFLMKKQNQMLFIDAVYLTIKDKTDLVLEEAEFMDIAGSVTDENKLYNAIFFFRWCYEKGEDGISNEKKYFGDFVDSDLFEAIFLGNSVEGIPFAVKKKETPQPDEPQPDETESETKDVPDISDAVVSSDEEETPEETKPADIQTPEVMNPDPADAAEPADSETAKPAAPVYTEPEKMDVYFAEKERATQESDEISKIAYLGYIEKRNTFYNFFPKFELMPDNTYRELSMSGLKQEYPTTGGINLYYVIQGESAHFLEDEIIADQDRDKEIGSIYRVDIDSYDLEPNNNDSYQIKLDLQKLAKRGEKLDKVIQHADECDIYKVVTCEFASITHANFVSGNITLKETNIVENEYVVLHYEDRYYGPFTAHCRTIDGKYYIKTGASDDYLIPYYPKKAVRTLEFEKQIYNEDPTYTTFAHVIGDQEWYDVVPDEVLLEKIIDEVSVELAVTNPEEFYHLCSNSPFLAELPQEIMESRILKLRTIVNNVEKFKEEKRKVFETLLKFYQSETAEVSDKMIKDSKLYNELMQQHSELRRINETAEQQIQELHKKLESHTDSGMTSEEEARYQERIRVLEEQVSMSKLREAEDRIEALKKEQNKLENNNEYLRSKAAEYNEKFDKAQTQVREAIEAACSGSIASIAARAFDPFISSEMLKAAASWDAQAETEEYARIKAAVSAVSASDRSDAELIDYIVEYVKARRAYSRNDIINIYTSIAQNFITIFSGEPGTGKTSMGNIISDTLGLMQFGERMNRFVSVSVERGWSSKRDLIGYFNPLTRKYDKSSSKIYDALRILDVEGTESRFPYVIMLDEANLSPIEYYWADFMRLTDRASLSDTCINIGTEQDLFVPETLRFIATINTDQTTESLSPRLIDRASIIKLPNVKPKQNVPAAPADCEKITWESFISAFSKDSELNHITQKAIGKIYDLFNAYGMTVSPRIQLVIEKYVKAAQGIMEDETGVLAREKALDFAIVQKLLPKINGYYANYERFFEQLKQLCKEYNLKMTDEAIDEIVNAQERNMGYCQYLI